MQMREDMLKFDRDVGTFEDCVGCLVQLCALGHFGFVEIGKLRQYKGILGRSCMCSADNLEQLRTLLQADLQRWKDTLFHARRSYQWLQHFRSDQLTTLHECLDHLQNKRLAQVTDDPYFLLLSSLLKSAAGATSLMTKAQWSPRATAQHGGRGSPGSLRQQPT